MTLVLTEQDMSEDEKADCPLLPPIGDAPWYRTKRKIQEMEASLFPPELDCDIWLRCNAVNSSEKLADLRYALYHGCSRGAFRISKTDGRHFEIAGEHSTLKVPNDGSRRYLISQLRKLTVRAMRRAWRAGNREARNPSNRYTA
jgi:hypothetical protein